jgi:hypothetical protein
MAFFSKAAATVAGFAAGAVLADKIGGIVSQTQQAFNKTNLVMLQELLQLRVTNQLPNLRPMHFPIHLVP